MYVNGAEPNPKDFKENIVSNKKFEGVIEKIFVKYNDKAKRNSISIINNSNFYGLGLHNEKFVKVGDVVLKEGMQVEFEYAGQFKNIDMNTFKIIQQEVSKEIKNKFEKENMGMLRCHAFNGATSLLVSEGKQVSKDSILDAAKVIHSVTVEMKEWFGNTELGKSLDQRELGNTVGNAVINCSNFSNRNSLSLNVKEFLTEIVPAMTNYISVKNDKQDASEKAAPEVKETKPEQVVNNTDNNEPGLDWDSDIPFAPVGLQYPQLLWVM